MIRLQPMILGVFNFMEIWKDIPNYEGYYQVSNLGRVKSLRYDRLLINTNDLTGYSRVILCIYGVRKKYRVHQLVAITFLNHKPDGTTKLVVDHINNNKTDNRLENLQLITHRENTSKDKKNKTGNTGVHKINNKFSSSIYIKGKRVHLGIFKTIDEAAYYRKSAEKSILINKDITIKKPNFSSKYKGVDWNKRCKKYRAFGGCGKRVFLGYFKEEIDAFNKIREYEKNNNN